MLHYNITTQANQKILETSVRGKALLSVPQLNKGTAFSEEERLAFGLLGKLPAHIETIEQQAERAYQQYRAYQDVLNRNLYLNQLLNTNQVLFYYLVNQHLEEMLPTIYTPIVGNAVKAFNKKYTQPRGIYLSFEDIDRIEDILKNRSNVDVKLVVASDGEGVLGIGDQGVGGMAIPVAKLMVYTAFAGIDPLTTLPVLLDTGTNNRELLEDPLYLGWRHERITGDKYNAFMDAFVSALKKSFPHLFLHWEDFGRTNAYRNLFKYRETTCCFNDDIQGTGVVALAALNSALKITKEPLTEQRIVVFGAGSAGMGVTERISLAIQAAGHSLSDAAKPFWLIDRNGLITEDSHHITDAQAPFARDPNELSDWQIKDVHHVSLWDVIDHVKPTVLIGCSAQAGAFTQTVIEQMHKHCERPIIFPLSNPNERAEAVPEDIIRWTKGQALIATGSPFDDVVFDDKTFAISQCNNYMAFPGIGLGVTAIQAERLSTGMLNAAAEALSRFPRKSNTALLPCVANLKEASIHIAIAVANQAILEKLAKAPKGESVEERVRSQVWTPDYLPYHAISPKR